MHGFSSCHFPVIIVFFQPPNIQPELERQTTAGQAPSTITVRFLVHFFDISRHFDYMLKLSLFFIQGQSVTGSEQHRWTRPATMGVSVYLNFLYIVLV